MVAWIYSTSPAKESIIRNAFQAGSRGQGFFYLNERLGSKCTFVEWDKVLMGPIYDKIGVEQGGCLSDRLYKLANNEQHSVAQASSLGLHMDEVCLSSIGLADDTCLLSSSDGYSPSRSCPLSYG